MPPPLIRPASADDVPAISDVFRRASLSNAGDRALFGDRPELLDYPVPPDDAVTLVAIADESLLGFASGTLGSEAMELVDIFVDPDHMQRGVGRALISALLDVARSHGQVRVEVDANRHALEFYERVGFVRERDVALEHGTAVRMSLVVDQPTAAT